jgi:hypothetical protein
MRVGQVRSTAMLWAIGMSIRLTLIHPILPPLTQQPIVAQTRFEEDISKSSSTLTLRNALLHTFLHLTPQRPIGSIFSARLSRLALLSSS